MLLIIVLEVITSLLNLNTLTISIVSILFLIGFIGSLFLSQGIHTISIDGNIFTATNLITRKSLTLNISDFKEFYIHIHFKRYAGFQFDLVFSDANTTYEPISLYYLESVHELVNELENKLRNTTKDEYRILDFLKTNNKN